MLHVALLQTYHLWAEDEIFICLVSHAYNILTELLANLKEFDPDLQDFEKHLCFSLRHHLLLVLLETFSSYGIMARSLPLPVQNLGSVVLWKPKSTTGF